METPPDDRLADVLQRILAFREARDWARFHNPKDVALSLALEAGEVLEWMQWRSGDELTEHLEANREGVGEELADVLYWTVLLAHDLGIDLADAFRRKMERNAEKYPVEKARGSHRKYTELAEDASPD
ncbi:MAG: nucleotide pyrophosphohydrolase [Armatimonadota bacterium]